MARRWIEGAVVQRLPEEGRVRQRVGAATGKRILVAWAASGSRCERRVSCAWAECPTRFPEKVRDQRRRQSAVNRLLIRGRFVLSRPFLTRRDQVHRHRPSDVLTYVSLLSTTSGPTTRWSEAEARFSPRLRCRDGGHLIELTMSNVMSKQWADEHGTIQSTGLCWRS